MIVDLTDVIMPNNNGLKYLMVFFQADWWINVNVNVILYLRAMCHF